MTSLRMRIIIGFAVVVSIVLTGGYVLMRLQRNHSIESLDERIESIANSPSFRDKFIELRSLALPPPTTYSNVYLGVVSPDGNLLETISASDVDLKMIPQFSNLILGDTPKTIRTAAGRTKFVRAMMVSLPEHETAIVAIPLDTTLHGLASSDRTMRFTLLANILTLTLLTWWVLLLGIRPIRKLTAAAKDAAAGLVPDISNVHTVTKEATELRDAVSTMVDAARGNEDRMRKFVSDASHELRTPLTTLRGYAELIVNIGNSESDVVADAARRINEESLRMNRLVDDLLTLTRKDELEVLQLENFDLLQIVDDVVNDIDVVQPSRDVIVKASLDIRVYGDKQLLTQAILAYATNALRHTPVTAKILITVQIIGDHVRVSLRDEGPGIDPIHIPFLFERFYRIEKGKARSGSGLGLAIVASIIKLHHGTLGVDSKLGEGSTFWFSIPHNLSHTTN